MDYFLTIYFNVFLDIFFKFCVVYLNIKIRRKYVSLFIEILI